MTGRYDPNGKSAQRIMAVLNNDMDAKTISQKSGLGQRCTRYVLSALVDAGMVRKFPTLKDMRVTMYRKVTIGNDR